MTSLSAKSILSPFFTNPEKIPNTKSNPFHLNLKKHISHKNPQKISSIFFSPTSKSPSPKAPPLSCLTINQPFTAQPSSVSQKVQSLDFEFKSLTKPVDKVKRLLHYAAILPPFDESSRTLENRVSGCTARAQQKTSPLQTSGLKMSTRTQQSCSIL
ncbi:SufE-like protein 2- chloroplastic [Striga hermonthica]|uniref:SufE-like protein 2- chloroplastic n=1 Tax=Striga hermonthica TaxID=68872 RepID=A0A9N7R9L1_STRHE|nr:SufE-like protein 2- chloroplastic [Striga hermonthica]